MIADATIAKQISEMMLEISRKLYGSVALVNATCSQEESTAYRRAVGRVLGEILLEILNPLYLKHPSLKPPEME
jgi:hypothetical protein